MILRRIVVRKQHSAPFDVKDTVRSAARDRRKDTAISTRETGAATQTDISALSSQTGKMVKSYGH